MLNTIANSLHCMAVLVKCKLQQLYAAPSSKLLNVTRTLLTVVNDPDWHVDLSPAQGIVIGYKDYELPDDDYYGELPEYVIEVDLYSGVVFGITHHTFHIESVQAGDYAAAIRATRSQIGEPAQQS